MDAGAVGDSLLVTLALPSWDAARAALAEEKGKIVLALTSPLDPQISKIRTAKLTDLW
jgi:hypothetical protein